MGGGKPGKSTGSLPYWMQSKHQALADKAENWAFGDAGAYNPYEGPQIAGLTDQELAANVAREEMFNRGDVAGQFAADQYSKSAGLTDQVRDVAFSEFDQAEYERRRNPYIDNVVGAQLREANQSYDRRLNQDQASSVARGGSIGSYRVGLENAFLESERAQQLGDIRNRGELDAYNQALGQFETDRSTRLGGLGQGAEQYNVLGAQANQLGTDSMAREQSLINELGRSGAIAREMQQAEYNLNVSEWDKMQAKPLQNMQALAGIYSGMPQPTQTTFTNPTAGFASQAAGFGLAGASMYNSFSGN